MVWSLSVRHLLVTIIIHICMNALLMHAHDTPIMTAFGILSLSSAWCLHCREVEPRLYGTVSSLVPPRSRLALKGPALHEYSSFLSQISRSESSRLQENNSRTKQRGRYVVDTEIMLAKLLVVMNLLC